MKRYFIKNGLIVNEGKTFIGSILTEEAYISRIFTGDESPDSVEGAETIDATGKLLLPGIIDDQVHFREPGLTHKGSIKSESRAAVAGGITSYMEMPNTIPQTTTIEALKEKQMIAAASSMANYSFYLGATNDNIDQVELVDPATVCGVKVFMGASTGNMLVDNEESLRKIFSRSPAIVACHCEDEKIIRANMAAYTEEYGEDIPIAYHPLIRSREACYSSSSFAVNLAMEYGTRLHILHLSTAEEMELFDNQIPLENKRITAEACVHHLWFDESSYKDRGTFIKWNPAIKKSSDREALMKAVNDDTIDVIATDHAPHTLQEKSNSYKTAPSGGPLVQHSLVAMLELWHNGAISLERIVRKMCHNPAILFGVKNRGYIREGYYADLVIVNPATSWQVKSGNILYSCGWSPFEGTTFGTAVETTFVNGIKAYNLGKFDESSRGLLLEFNR